MGKGRSSRLRGSSISPKASKETLPSKTLSPASPKITGDAPSSPFKRNSACPIKRFTSVPSARMKLLDLPGLMPKRRSNDPGTTE